MTHRDRALIPDYTNCPLAADKLIERIKAAWRAKGYPEPLVIKAKPQHGETGTVPRYDIRSDMVNGMPKKRGQGASA